ncbi:unnamed protein product [Prorocentrum cordatum]|uniref:Uncharacterized protein n=1 Tax=Prorocentrum cordatum TaxID=2364126 RepID=A0ABN9XYI8_9DINO|nr:unnamed protein product [Polarella glacialis]
MLQAEACRRRRRSETQGRKEHTGGGSRMVLAKTTKSAARMLTLICSLRMCHQATSDDPVSTGIREDTAKRLNQTVALDYAFSSKRDGTSLSKFVQHDRRCLAQKSLRLRTMQEPLAGCHACAEARSPGIRGSPMWSTPAPRSRSTSYIYIHSSLPRARGRGQPCLWEDLSRAAGAARPRCQRWALPPSPLARQAPDSGVRRRGAWAGGGSQEAAYGGVCTARGGGKSTRGIQPASAGGHARTHSSREAKSKQFCEGTPAGSGRVDQYSRPSGGGTAGAFSLRGAPCMQAGKIVQAVRTRDRKTLEGGWEAGGR